ncbi:MAG: hypothetical protein CM1200mP26_15740 [Acidimicrobiales bacterium]|nr:MAG: hypothetical protein CM1200mP26_15740 [Acidimicrobiales bacterium]
MEIATRLKQVTDLPVLVGVGVGTPEQASRLPGTGTAWWSVQRSSSGWWIKWPRGVAELVAEFRVALDA